MNYDLHQIPVMTGKTFHHNILLYSTPNFNFEEYFYWICFNFGNPFNFQFLLIIHQITYWNFNLHQKPK